MNVGYFADKEREYIIENMYPVRPLKNYLWNDTIFAELNQFCFGNSKCCINKEFKPLVSDVRLMYIKDEESGDMYDCNRNFAKRPFEKFQAKVGLGYQTTESTYGGLKTALTATCAPTTAEISGVRTESRDTDFTIARSAPATFRVSLRL